jgi:hypothetical protein
MPTGNAMGAAKPQTALAKASPGFGGPGWFNTGTPGADNFYSAPQTAQAPAQAPAPERYGATIQAPQQQGAARAAQLSDWTPDANVASRYAQQAPGYSLAQGFQLWQDPAYRQQQSIANTVGSHNAINMAEGGHGGQGGALEEQRMQYLRATQDPSVMPAAFAQDSYINKGLGMRDANGQFRWTTQGLFGDPNTRG